MADQVFNGRLVLPGGVRGAGLHVRDGKIHGIITDASQTLPRAEVYDYRGKYIIPGLIEVHGHMREPGLSHKEDYETGTKAAVAGGVTTILDMPNTVPPTTTIQLLREKASIPEGRSFCDYTFFFGGARDNAAEIARLDPREVAGVKFFMAGHETTPTTVTDMGDLYVALRAMQGKNLVALFHAENQSLINKLSAEFREAGRDDGRAYSEGRGPVTARTAIAEALSLCYELNIPAYICHISTGTEYGAIEDLKNRDFPAYAEVVGYHLTFSIDDYDRLGTLIKVSPPVREAAERDKVLWKLLADGRLDTLASEHTPHTRDEKNQPMSKAASGTPGIQENLIMVVTQYRERFPDKSLDEIIEQVARMGSTNVARIFGLSSKGSLEVGKDADFTILDPNKTHVFEEREVLSKCGWSAYAGMTATCAVEATWLRGVPVFEAGNIVGTPRGQRIWRM